VVGKRMAVTAQAVAGGSAGGMGTPAAMPVPVPPRPRLRPPAWTPSARLRLYTAAVAAAAGVLALLVIGSPTPFVRPISLPWPLLAVAFAAAEAAVVHLRFRRDAHSFSLSEIPLVLGLFLATPGSLLLAQVVGAAVALIVIRRQPPLKVAFNLACMALQAGVAILVFGWIAALGDPLGPAGWTAAIAAMLVALLAADVLINSAVRLSGGSMGRHEMAKVFALGAGATVVNTSLALVGVTILWLSPSAAWLALVSPLAIFTAYAADTAQHQQRDRLESLYRATRVLHESPQLESAMVAAVRQACALLEAEAATATLFPSNGSGTALRTATDASGTMQVMEAVELDPSDELWVHLLAAPRPLLLPTTAGIASQCLPETAAKDALCAPLVVDDELVGIIAVANRLGDVGGFHNGDAKLLASLASHVSISLENSRLEDSLAAVTYLKDQLRHQTLHDPLTELANRVLFGNRIGHALERRGSATSTAVLFVDLDDFKTINDTRGHAVGDAVLIAVAQRLRACTRPEDTCARLAGDEFGILLTDIINPADATALGQRLLAALEAPVEVNGVQVPVRASVGLAFATPGTTVDELLNHADLAMYKAKREGKGSFRVFEEDLGIAAAERLALRADLRSTLESEQLGVCYQPIIALQSGAVAGVEALARWDHPQLGSVSPETFVPIAEEAGLFREFGRWMLEQASGQLRAWSLEYPDVGLTLHVNLSARQLCHPDVVDDVTQILSAAGVDPTRLVLEIFEATLLEDTASIRSTLAEFQRMGVRFALDDFGTGYSSLSLLDQLPVDMLKLDKSFVAGIAATGSPLVPAMVELGRGLGLETVAEGIETPQQLASLRAMGCELGQGYLLAAPMDAADMGRWLGATDIELVEMAAGGHVG